MKKLSIIACVGCIALAIAVALFIMGKASRVYEGTVVFDGGGQDAALTYTYSRVRNPFGDGNPDRELEKMVEKYVGMGVGG